MLLDFNITNLVSLSICLYTHAYIHMYIQYQPPQPPTNSKITNNSTITNTNLFVFFLSLGYYSFLFRTKSCQNVYICRQHSHRLHPILINIRNNNITEKREKKIHRNRIEYLHTHLQNHVITNNSVLNTQQQ